MTQKFEEYFGETILEMLDAETSTIYGLSADLRLALLNEGWFAFARKNGAPPEFYEKYGLGGSYLEAVPAVLKEFFASHLRSSIASRRPWTFDYECPSPTCHQQVRMHVLPMARGLGCIVSNTGIVERPHDRQEGPGYDGTPGEEVLRDIYADPKGAITMCVHCRRTKCPASEQSWDWVPSFLEHPPENVCRTSARPVWPTFPPRRRSVSQHV
ncbi:MAG: hypothetical protein ACLFVJ_16090 [Persicimonas sp.]